MFFLQQMMRERWRDEGMNSEVACCVWEVGQEEVERVCVCVYALVIFHS